MEADFGALEESNRAGRGEASSFAGGVQVFLIANAGLLLKWNGVSLLLDGIFRCPRGPFSSPSPSVWQAMMEGRSPFEVVDCVLFTHGHEDHFSPELALEFLRRRSVRALFLPMEMAGVEGLLSCAKDQAVKCMELPAETGGVAFQVSPGLQVQAFSVRHLDKRYHSVPHLCYLISFGAKRLLFTADSDYTYETFDFLGSQRLRAVFVNPLFFSALSHGRFFKGSFDAEDVVVYHVPFKQDDSLKIGPALSRDRARWSAEKTGVLVLDEELQRLEL